MLRHCILVSLGAGSAYTKQESRQRTALADQGSGAGELPPGKEQTKKRSHLVIGEIALLIADYFDRVGSLKISR